MKLLIILNKDAPKLSSTINGLAHMTFGMGHRIQGKPSVDLVFGDNQQVRVFRHIAKTYATSNDNVVFTDFPHTMVGYSTDDLLEKVAATPESAIQYFGACFLTADSCPDLEEFMESCSHLKEYTPFSSNEEVTLLPKIDSEAYPSYVGPEMKIVMLFPAKKSLASLLNQAVLASLSVGNQVPYKEQYLLNIAGTHPEEPYSLCNISYHSYPILKADASKAKQMHHEMQEHEEITTSQSDADSVFVAFGEKSIISGISQKARLFSDQLAKNAFIESTQEKAAVNSNRLIGKEPQKVTIIQEGPQHQGPQF